MKRLVAVLAALITSAHAAEFGPCLAELRGEATANGISTKTFDAATATLEPDQSVLDAMAAQPEFEAPVWDYLARLVDDKRISEGKANLIAWRKTLTRAEKQFGVDRETIVAVWGVETDYGRIMGQRPLIRSLATLSCFGTRQRYFRTELVAALKILQAGDVKPNAFKGSWAGAFGHTQFMPSTFARFAVDFDRDGRRDLFASIPDALASVGNYLKGSGWIPGQHWGFEVRPPPSYDGPSGRHNKRELEEWKQLGIHRANGKPLEGHGMAALLLPTGTRGPAFLVFKNFDAIHSYNASESYALAIAHLSDRLRGWGPIKAKWPTDDPILSRTERVELQSRLLERGFYGGVPDGIIGSRTVAAIKDFQKSAGIPADGYASAQVLKALRESIPPV